uniref:Uncharacterized protein n=1 Tax=Anguilla anguilla TaxID=7936 RepID=A0A0E9XBI2_ANGAN
MSCPQEVSLLFATSQFPCSLGRLRRLAPIVQSYSGSCSGAQLYKGGVRNGRST